MTPLAQHARQDWRWSSPGVCGRRDGRARVWRIYGRWRFAVTAVEAVQFGAVRGSYATAEEAMAEADAALRVLDAEPLGGPGAP